MDQEDKLQSLVDQAAVADVMYAYAFAVDTREWELYRSILADRLEIDFTSYFGGDPMTIDADVAVFSVKALFPGFESTQHLMANPRVTIDGDRATCVMSMRAEHFLPNSEGDSLHTIGGHYTAQLTRTVEGWKLRRLELTVRWQSGNKHIMTLAGARATAINAAQAQEGS